MYRENRLVDALCLAFMVFYTTPLCALGYEETMRMHGMREGLRVVSVDLQRQRDRLSRYVASPVARRLRINRRRGRHCERRWLTVAFVDISDFTALTERLEPEDLTMLLDEFFAALVGTGRMRCGESAQISRRRRADQFWRIATREAPARCASVRGDAWPTRVSVIDRLNADRTQQRHSGRC